MPPFDPEADALRARMQADLAEIARTVMPFGRHAGWPLHALSAEYLHYFEAHGWPKGRIGELMRMVYQMKADGSGFVFPSAHNRLKPDA